MDTLPMMTDIHFLPFLRLSLISLKKNFCSNNFVWDLYDRSELNKMVQN